MMLAWSGKCSQTRTPGTLVAMVRNGPRTSAGASGFGSQVSRWLGPPDSQMRITALRPRRCPRRGPLSPAAQQGRQRQARHPGEARLQEPPPRADPDQVGSGGLQRIGAEGAGMFCGMASAGMEGKGHEEPPFLGRFQEYSSNEDRPDHAPATANLDRSAEAIGEASFRVDPQAVVDRGRHVLRGHRVGRRVSPVLVAGAVDASRPGCRRRRRRPGTRSASGRGRPAC